MLNFIIIQRLDGGIGDYVCLTSIIREINEKYSDKKIIIVCGNTVYYENNPRIFKVINIKKRLIKILLRYSSIFLPKLGIPYYNFDYNNGIGNRKEFIENNPEKHYAEINSLHINLNLNYKKLKNEIFFSEKELKEFDKKFSNLPKKYILIHSQSKKTFTYNKEIGFEKMQSIVSSLSDQMQFLQVGLSEEQFLDGSIDFRGKTQNLKELFYLISKAKLVVCMEGGYNHLADAFGINSITIFTGFLPKKLFEYGYTHSIQVNVLPKCYPCQLRKKCNDMKCVSNELVTKTISKIKDLY